MDPNACLTTILTKLSNGDTRVAEDLSNLSEWIGNGGFLPDVGCSDTQMIYGRDGTATQATVWTIANLGPK